MRENGAAQHRRAWLAIATIPLFFVLGFAAGEATLGMLGHPSGSDVPTWAALIADVIAGAIGAAPAVMAVRWARRARRAGVALAAVPMAIGILVIAALVALVVVSELGDAM